MDDTSVISETDSGIEVNISNGLGISAAGTSIVYVRFSVPALDVEVCDAMMVIQLKYFRAPKNYLPMFDG